MSVRVGEMDENKLSARTVLIVMVAGIVCALVGAAAAYIVTSNTETRYRAETQVALLPARNTAPADLSNTWEALSRGQAARVAAQVLGQRRWLGPAAQSAGVPATSIELSAGAVADTTLIDVALEAGSPAAAEAALDQVVVEARPVVEDVSGPFALEVVQPASGSAKKLGVGFSQLLAVSGAAGLLIGVGIALLVIRSRARRMAGPVAVRQDYELVDVEEYAEQPAVTTVKAVDIDDRTRAIAKHDPGNHINSVPAGNGQAITTRRDAGRPDPATVNGRPPSPGVHERSARSSSR